MADWIPTFSELDNFRFLRPLILLALALLPLAFLLLHRAHVQRGAWAQLIDPALQRFVLTTSLQTKGKRKSWLGYLLAALLIVALAGPTWEQLPQPVYSQQQPVVIALDLSQSMNAQDLIPTRLQVAKIKLRDLLRKRRDGQTALITFAGDAFLVTPLTDDTHTIVSMLPSLAPRIMPSQGSRLEPALVMAGNLLQQSGAEPGEVILITDGVSDDAAAQDMASQLARDGHRVSVIAVGTAQGGLIKNARGDFLRDRRGKMVMAPMEVKRLKDVANAGRGVLFDSSVTDDQLDTMLLRDLSGFVGATSSDQEFTTDLWREQGPLLVLLCLPFLALAFRRGVLLCVVAFVIMPQPYVEAGLWADAWKRPDQQGEAAFEREEFEAAAELYEQRKWQAAALYRAGKYADSAATLEGIDTPDAHYNRGNALARAEEIKDAIKAYEQALVQEPGHEDAEFNLELLKQMQQEQEQQSEEEQDQQEGDQEQESDQQQDGESGDNQEQSESDEQSGEEESEESEEQESQEQDGQTQEEREAERERMQAQLAEEMTEEEQQQAVEQWLRRIPDDPGGLLRRKFKRQYRERGPARRNSGEEW